MLRALGGYLVRTDPPAPSDVALVLGGDYYGDRILKAAELMSQGIASKVVVSGPAGFFGRHESDLAIPFAVKHGYPDRYFLAMPNEAQSTKDEARQILPSLRKWGVHRILLVTSTYHTRRAGSIFRSIAPDLQFRVYGVEDRYFHPNDWWHSREASKTFVIEWLKTFATWSGV